MGDDDIQQDGWLLAGFRRKLADRGWSMPALVLVVNSHELSEVNRWLTVHMVGIQPMEARWVDCMLCPFIGEKRRGLIAFGFQTDADDILFRLRFSEWVVNIYAEAAAG